MKAVQHEWENAMANRRVQALLMSMTLAATFAAMPILVLAQAAAPSRPIANTASVTAQDTILSAKVAARVQEEMQKQGLVGVSVAIGRGDKVVHVASFGFEDRENKVAASNDTMYRWASVSKPVTAVAAMQLWKAGSLDLDADVRTIVPEFPEKPHVLTTRQLLGHLGGIVHYSNGPVVVTKRKYDTQHPFQSVILALDTFKESPLVNVPGEAYAYTTHGYILASAAVEKAGKKPFAEQVQERIVGPLGMSTCRPDYQWEKIEHRAVGYKKRDDGVTVRSTDTDVSWKLGGGGYISNAADMAKFGLGMLGEQLVDRKTRDLMWTRQTLKGGKRTGYGLGFSVRTKRGGLLEVNHSGSQEKARTQLLILPARDGKPSEVGEGVVVAVLCNTEHAELMDLARDLAAMVEGGPKAADGGKAGTEQSNDGNQ